ncbi:MAG: ATPase, partial [Rikenellaceae bacterium]|nr:ATPase [Rikenellaceae bacterium]
MKKDGKWTLVADSGSTKTDWRFLNGGETVAAQTVGINPVYQSPEEITATIRTGLRDVPEAVGSVYFYGAGCLPVTKRAVETALRKVWREAAVEVESDLLGAARGLCGDGQGIVSILGTGSNSCCYDGGQIVRNTPPMGFILGDEGSGAHLGKLLINGIFKNRLPREIADDLFEEYRLDRNLIIEAVYRKPFPNRFLARFARY